MSGIFDDRVSTEINYLACVAIGLNIANNVAQTIYTSARRTTADFSLVAVALWVLSSILWIIYGIALQNIILIISSSVSATTAVVIILFMTNPTKKTKSDRI